jgi:hypothetical protein
MWNELAQLAGLVIGGYDAYQEIQNYNKRKTNQQENTPPSWLTDVPDSKKYSELYKLLSDEDKEELNRKQREFNANLIKPLNSAIPELFKEIQQFRNNPTAQNEKVSEFKSKFSPAITAIENFDEVFKNFPIPDTFKDMLKSFGTLLDKTIQAQINEVNTPVNPLKTVLIGQKNEPAPNKSTSSQKESAPPKNRTI